MAQLKRRLNFEKAIDKELDTIRENYIQNIENKFRGLAPEIAERDRMSDDMRQVKVRGHCHRRHLPRGERRA